ncbi:hypothetical protein ONZ45_g1910 [Pleurotus djamor]|nr:hypothetical protein ONZ45_g1910 [Pleurotus djamor]
MLAALTALKQFIKVPPTTQDKWPFSSFAIAEVVFANVVLLAFVNGQSPAAIAFVTFAVMAFIACASLTYNKFDKSNPVTTINDAVTTLSIIDAKLLAISASEPRAQIASRLLAALYAMVMALAPQGMKAIPSKRKLKRLLKKYHTPNTSSRALNETRGKLLIDVMSRIHAIQVAENDVRHREELKRLGKVIENVHGKFINIEQTALLPSTLPKALWYAAILMGNVLMAACFYNLPVAHVVRNPFTTPYVDKDEAERNCLMLERHICPIFERLEGLLDMNPIALAVQVEPSTSNTPEHTYPPSAREPGSDDRNDSADLFLTRQPGSLAQNDSGSVDQVNLPGSWLWS